MNEMVQRVTDAVLKTLWSAQAPLQPDGKMIVSAAMMAEAEAVARAAVAAMREPTQPMIDRGMIKLGRIQAYQAMIDEALKDG